jgi:hypothetical protein
MVAPLASTFSAVAVIVVVDVAFVILEDAVDPRLVDAVCPSPRCECECYRFFGVDA